MKIFKSIKILFVGFSITLLISSCQWVTIEQPEVVVPEVVSFSVDIQPILTNKCTSCHKPSGFAASIDLTDGNAYNTIINMGLINETDPPSSLIILPQTDQYPHTNHLSANDKALIEKWIEDGHLDN